MWRITAFGGSGSLLFTKNLCVFPTKALTNEVITNSSHFDLPVLMNDAVMSKNMIQAISHSTSQVLLS